MQLATNDVYRDFILLDPYDAVAVNDFLEGGEAGKGQSSVRKGSTSRKSFQSPTRCSGGTAHKSSLGRNKDGNLHPSPVVNCSSDVNGFNVGPDPPANADFGNSNHGFDMDDNYSEPRDFNKSDDEDDDPWKPLNPHEPGNLKVKPFRKGWKLHAFLASVMYPYSLVLCLILWLDSSLPLVKAFRRIGVNSAKRTSVTTMFPLAKLHGTISPELIEIWEARNSAFQKQRTTQSPPLYEKVMLFRFCLPDLSNGCCIKLDVLLQLRQSLANEGQEIFDGFGHPGNYNDDKGYGSEDPDLGPPEYMDEDVPLQHDNVCRQIFWFYDVFMTK